MLCNYKCRSARKIKESGDTLEISKEQSIIALLLGRLFKVVSPIYKVLLGCAGRVVTYFLKTIE